MPKQNQPITHTPKQEDESTGHGSERHGVHRQKDEALPGRSGTRHAGSRDSNHSTGDVSRDSGGDSMGGISRESGRDRQGNPTRGTSQT